MTKMVDLGLTYEQALHGVQTGIAYEMDRAAATTPKHLRVGIKSALSNCLALAELLIDKGVCTREEYMEYLRLSANNELARYEGLHPRMKFR